eukprot:jgi/Chlat1/7946/Chrsp68S07374
MLSCFVPVEEEDELATRADVATVAEVRQQLRSGSDEYTIRLKSGWFRHKTGALYNSDNVPIMTFQWASPSYLEVRHVGSDALLGVVKHKKLHVDGSQLASCDIMHDYAGASVAVLTWEATTALKPQIKGHADYAKLHTLYARGKAANTPDSITLLRQDIGGGAVTTVCTASRKRGSNTIMLTLGLDFSVDPFSLVILVPYLFRQLGPNAFSNSFIPLLVV